MGIYTVGLAEAKNNFSKITAEINRTKKPVTVFKNNKPWVIIQPAAEGIEAESNDIAQDILEAMEYGVCSLIEYNEQN